MAQLHANTLINGRYRVGELLAMGGMAEVWVAEDVLLGRRVALKVLRAGLAPDVMAADRLRAEAKAAAMLTSDRVVRVLDVGEVVDDDGRVSPYLVMELVQGDTLRDRMLAGPLPPDRVRKVLTQVAGALAEAHALGIVHRDVKPANVLVTPEGDCKVTDFGISSSAGSPAYTATGLVMGTARYLSPEQVSGQRATAASDVYSLGVIAHEALRGEPMFAADGDIEAALAHLQQPPPALPATVPATLAALVLRMLSKDPLERPSAAEVATGIRPTPTRTIPLVTVPPAATRRPRALAAVCLAALLLAAAVIGLTGGSYHPPMPTRVVDSSPLVTPTPKVTPTATPRTTRVTTPVTTVAHTAPVVRHAPPAHKRPKGHGKKKDD